MPAPEGAPLSVTDESEMQTETAPPPTDTDHRDQPVITPLSVDRDAAEMGCSTTHEQVAGVQLAEPIKASGPPDIRVTHHSDGQAPVLDSPRHGLSRPPSRNRLKESLPPPGLRASRSIPGFHARGVKAIMPDARGFYHASAGQARAQTVQRSRAASASVVIPNGPLHGTQQLLAYAEERDVIGRLMGWRGRSADRPLSPSADAPLPATITARPGQKATAPPLKRSKTLDNPSTGNSPFGEGVKGLRELSKSLNRTRLPSDVARLANPFPSRPSADELAGARRISESQRYKEPMLFDLFSESRTQRSCPSSVIESGLQPRNGSVSSLNSCVSDELATTAADITVCNMSGDDPRFVIWGDIRRRPLPMGKSDGHPRDTASPGQKTQRWSLNRDRKASSASRPLNPSLENRTDRVILAATVERWVAELTNESDEDLIGVFLLTYRLYLSSSNLLSCLTTRFEWSLATANHSADDASRRTARVRVIEIMRRWLLHFFREDFAFDRNLRLALCDWLNNLAKDPRLGSDEGDQQLLESLKTDVRAAKQSYILYRLVPPPHTSASSISLALASSNKPAQSADQAQSVSSAAPETQDGAASEALIRAALPYDHERDVDLDFDALVAPSPADSRLPVGAEGVQAPPSASPGNVSAASSPVGEPPADPQERPQEPDEGSVGEDSAGHSRRIIARTVDTTFGRVRRMVGGQRARQLSISAIEQDTRGKMDSGGDLLYAERPAARRLTASDANDGVSQYSYGVSEHSSVSPTDSSGVDTPAMDSDVERHGAVRIADDSEDGLGIFYVQHSVPDEASPGLHHSRSSQTIKTAKEYAVTSTTSAMLDRPNALASSSSSSGSSIPPTSGRMRPLFASSFFPDNGDLELSSSDEEESGNHARVRRVSGAKKLRQATHLRVLLPRNSADTFSSNELSDSASFWHQATTHGRAGLSKADQTTSGPFIVNDFVAEGLDSDDDEPGDVEAALRRLEGQISETQRAANARRVDAQLKKSAAVLARRRGMCHTRKSAAAASAADSDSDDHSTSLAEVSSMSSAPGTSAADPSLAVHYMARETSDSEQAVPVVEADSGMSGEFVLVNADHAPASTSLLAPPPRLMSRKPSLLQIITRGLTRPRLTGQSNDVYRSFIMHFKTERVAQHFALIERDMVSAVGWSELLRSDWKRAPPRQRVKWDTHLDAKGEQAQGPVGPGDPFRPETIGDILARFNLVCNWCSSEVLLTSRLDERVALVNKMIRLAWKCYRQSNFQTLVQLILGLHSPHVQRLRKTWSRIGVWERRVFEDLTAFTAPSGNFAALRQAMHTIADDHGHPRDASERKIPSRFAMPLRSSSGTRPKTPATGCVPFFGLFLRDIDVANEMPTFLDPTSPGIAVLQADVVDSPANPGAFDHLPALPLALPMRPLVNVHKQRVLAGIVENVALFQDAAASYEYELDADLARKCNALDCLPTPELMRAHSLQCEPL